MVEYSPRVNERLCEQMNSIGLGTMTDQLPTAEKVGKALAYLGDTDVKYAQQVGLVKKLDAEKARVIALVKLASEEKSDAAKGTAAHASNEYKTWVDEYRNAIVDLEITKAHRKLAELTVEVWRSANANRRQAGQV